ncbi:hypothetical protein [Paenibacillus sp. 22594]|uniref:hypothetical protein n=1 Tax=Paenibacillus sp. 22594 TaxID=3453947 RepID=UPI003F830771
MKNNKQVTNVFNAPVIGLQQTFDTAKGTQNIDPSIINTEEFKDIFRKKADIRIVDIAIDEKGRFPELDIKLRNIGAEVAFLKEISFNISEFYEMIDPQITQFSRVESSYTYDVLLSGLENKIHPISQEIPPNGVDRFKIKLANTLGDPKMPAIYRINLSFFYNEDNCCLNSKEMVLAIPSIEECIGYYVGDFSKENAKKNYINMKRFNQLDILKSNYFLKIFESYDKNKNDYL